MATQVNATSSAVRAAVATVSVPRIDGVGAGVVLRSSLSVFVVGRPHDRTSGLRMSFWN
jgi:hypothetical protein